MRKKKENNSKKQFTSQIQKDLQTYENTFVKRFKMNQTNLTKVPAVGTIKELAADTHPEVLAKYRTERAAFRPGGILPATTSQTQLHHQTGAKKNNSSSSGGGGSNGNEASGNVNLPIDILQQELAKTEDAINRQKLKIGLNAKTKHYEMEPQRHRK